MLTAQLIKAGAFFDGSRPYVSLDLRSLAHTEPYMKVVAGIVSQEACHRPRASAESTLLYRGLGRAPQPHAGEDDSDIRITPAKWLTGPSTSASC